MTAQEAAAVRALLAARAAAGGATPTGPRTTSAPRGPPPARPPRTRTGRPSAARRAPARTAAEKRARRPAQPPAWRRYLAAQDAPALEAPGVVVALGIVLPAFAGALSPTPPVPATARRDRSAAWPPPPSRASPTTPPATAGCSRTWSAAATSSPARRPPRRGARADAATAQAAVGDSSADLYRMTPEQRLPCSASTCTTTGSVSDVLWLQGLAERADDDRSVDVVRAARAQQAVTAAAAATRAARVAVDAAEAESGTLLAEVREQVADLTPATTAQLAGLGAVPAAGEQQERNQPGPAPLAGLPRRARRRRHPAARRGRARRPRRPARRLLPRPRRHRRADPRRGLAVAGNRPVTVLPAETVAAVSVAFAQLGRPYQAGGTGPDAYDCGGLAAAAWMQGGLGLPATAAGQWTTGAPVPASQLQVGDLVFADGGADVGLYLGEGQVLGASAAGWSVGVRR